MTTTLLQGDCRDLLKTLPDRSVQCCITSPPYFGLRDYQTATWDGGDPACDHIKTEIRTRLGLAKLGERFSGGGHAQPEQIAYRDTCGKCGALRIDKQIGLEQTPAAYVAALVAVFREVKRVLRDDGTLWLNLGDSYAGSWGNYGGQNRGKGTQREITNGSQAHQQAYDGLEDWRPPTASVPGLKPKDLIGIPWRVAFALQDDGWYLRSDIIWSKPNPMPESVTDRPTKAHEYLFLLAKSERYYYDAAAIAEAVKQSSIDRINQPNFDNQTGGPKDYGTTGVNPNRSMRGTLENFAKKGKGGKNAFRGQGHFRDGENGPANREGRDMQDVGAGLTRNRRTVWTIATRPYADAHFATFPEALVEPCILAGSAAQACPHCGAAWMRIVEKGDSSWERRKADGDPIRYGLAGNAAQLNRSLSDAEDRAAGGFGKPAVRIDLGHAPSCTCPDNDGSGRSVVLDPFMGSGTVARVAERFQRDSIGIDLSYSELQAKRTDKIQVEMFV